MINILIIDDQESIASGLKQVLANKGYSVQTSLSAMEALLLINSVQFDFIISDLKMPEMSGMELVKKLRALNYPAGVILISAYFTIEDAISALRLGVSDLFPKPFNTHELVTRIEELHSKEGYGSKNPSLTPKKNNDYRFMMGPDEKFVVFNYYRNNEDIFRYFSYKMNDNDYRICITLNFPDETADVIHGAFISLNQQGVTFEKLCDTLGSNPLLGCLSYSDKGYILLNFESNIADYFFNGSFSFTCMFPFRQNNNKDDIMIFNKTKGRIVPEKNWVFIFHDKDSTDQEMKENVSFKTDICLNPGFMNINEKFVGDLFRKLPHLKNRRPLLLLYGIYDSMKEQYFCYRTEMENIDLNEFIKFFKTPLEINLNDQNLIVNIMCFLAEIISNLKENGFKDEFNINLKIIPGIRINLDIKGREIRSYAFYSDRNVCENELLSGTDLYWKNLFDDGVVENRTSNDEIIYEVRCG